MDTWLHTPRKQALKVQIRWRITQDMPEVLDIERNSFECVWTEEDFLQCLRQRNCIGMVAIYNYRVVGFMIYELHKSKLHVLNFAVDPAFRRQAIGCQMVEKLIDKLSNQRRNEIALEVRESNIGAQLFFRKMGFKATLVLRGHYDDTNEDAYLMRFMLEPDEAEQWTLPLSLKNRISEYDAA